ncbi:tumor necrosis factor receptor superfamily member 14-like [Latimeria chalumnae]|uniref:tumor necrosis factor receptor superfamily member 14-like n=1 Tax=Latimeria chalumnae TaxID=7897 RepID=UPI0003C13C71|nr:PREDICTED: tumor necrosis factor receptor superfamily member 14-like [Latimeria chalumnae]|eukprot:XP_005986084.1 PREDICTED: tumor necrosis factor receptor superfamily member 14-like [Latimeria chalumnae]
MASPTKSVTEVPFQLNLHVVLILWVAVCELELKVAASCTLGEYQIKNGDCCPLCPPGSRVYRYCTPEFGTVCIPCMKGTYMDHPNGLLMCLPCSVCDPELGLSVDQECTYTKNTQCSCQKGYHCIDSQSNGCGTCRKTSVNLVRGEEQKVTHEDWA